MQQPSSREIRKLFDSFGQRAWLELALRYGKSFRMQGYVMTCEPPAIRALLMDREHTEKRSRWLSATRIIPGIDGLLFRDGDPWLERLRAVMPAFQRSHVDTFAGWMHDVASRRLATWGPEAQLPSLYDELMAVGVEVVLRVGFGLDPDDPLARRLGDTMVAHKRQILVADASRRIDDFSIGLWGKVRQIPSVLSHFAHLRSLHGEITTAVAAIESRRVGDSPGWVHGLRSLRFSMKQLASELNHLYFAFNAIDYVLTCGLFELARRPELVRLLRAEWTTVLKDRTHPGREDFAALPKTVAFMREIFRLYPVSMTVQRRTGALLEVGDETLPSGSHVAILLYALHRHPEFWERGDELDIERWQAKPRVDFSYVPFLDGPRKCIGRHLGELHFLVVLHAILSKRDLLIDDDLAVQSFAMPRLERPLRATARARTA